MTDPAKCPDFPSPISLRRLRAWTHTHQGVLTRHNDQILDVAVDGWRNWYRLNKFAKPHPQGLYWWQATERIGWMAEASTTVAEQMGRLYEMKDYP